MKKNVIVGQSGGPTAVINASLYGVVYEALNREDACGTREFDSCIIKIVRAGRIKPVLFLSSFSLYYLVIFSDM